MIDILSLTKAELANEMVKIGAEKYRAEQIYDWIHVKRITDFSKITNLKSQFINNLNNYFCIKTLKINKRLESTTDNTVKYLYNLCDGNQIETVVMEYNHGNSICISSQVGCKMGCEFCASARLGFVRNLTASEMLLQIYNSEKDLQKKISNIVIMGIGEPMDNFDNIIKFLELTTVGMRNITLSTCGLIPQIKRLQNLHLGLTLSVSLHAPNQQKREKIMPISKKYPLTELIPVCKEYAENTSRRITFEYTVIDGFNNSQKDAQQLSNLLKGINCHVNLIPVNPISETDFKAGNAEKFKNMLRLNATVRRTLGADINAACGTLRAS